MITDHESEQIASLQEKWYIRKQKNGEKWEVVKHQFYIKTMSLYKLTLNAEHHLQASGGNMKTDTL